MPSPKLFTEFIFENSKLGLKSRGPILRLQGCSKTTRLDEQEFRILLFLRQRQGDIASMEELEAFLYGDDDEREVSLYSNVPIRVTTLNTKLRAIQDSIRFLLLSQREAGYYLADLEHPENFYQGADAMIRQILIGPHR
jgi:DNA-binding response OmpR family regulator